MEPPEKRLQAMITTAQEEIEDRLIVLLSPDKARSLREDILSLCDTYRELGKLEGHQSAMRLFGKRVSDNQNP